MNIQDLLLVASILLLFIVHIPLWRRFHDSYRNGSMLQMACTYSKTGKLESNFDFYPSWRKHPLQVNEYQGFIKTLGLFLRLSGLQPMTGAFLLQFIFTLIMSLCLSLLMPPNLAWLPFAAAVCCISPLYLSMTIMPDMYLMSSVSFVLALLHFQNSMPHYIFAILLGLSGWLGVRIKTSGFIQAFSICCVLPFLQIGILSSILIVLLIFCPFITDILQARENVIIQLLNRQRKYFGYTIIDEQNDTPPDMLLKRNIFRRFTGILKLITSGTSTALLPWKRFSFYRSNGLIYIAGVAGIATSFFSNQNLIAQPIYIFAFSYLFFFLTFHTQLRRFFHFASRAGGTLFPIWLLFSTIVLTHWHQIDILLIFLILGFEGYKVLSAFLPLQPKSIYFEPPLFVPHKGGKVIEALRSMSQTNDLLMLTYQDLNSFCIALNRWQIPIEIEKTTIETMCKYIDYYRFDGRYRKIFLILPPGKALFLDKELQPHFLEEEPLFSRFNELYSADILDGYRIFEAIRPTHFADLTIYERKSPDQLKNNPIIFDDESAHLRTCSTNEI